MTKANREAVIAALQKDRNAHSAQTIAYRLGYRPARHGILAATNALRRLEAAGIVTRISPRDQWECAKWVLRSQ